MLILLHMGRHHTLLLANEIQKYESKDKNKGPVQVWKWIVCVCGNEIKRDIQIDCHLTDMYMCTWRTLSYMLILSHMGRPCTLILANEIQMYECTHQNKGSVQVWKWIVWVCGTEIKKILKLSLNMSDSNDLFLWNCAVYAHEIKKDIVTY